MNQRTAFVFYLLAVITYSQNVKPILDAHCVECHSTGNDLELARFPFPCATSQDQPSIVDMMLQKVGATPPQMPPGNRPKLDPSEVNVLQRWLDQGLAP